MLTKLKHAVKHSAVYSISNVATKAIGIILLPIYTDYFTPEQYGDLGLLLITITILSQVLVAGQGHAVIRFNNDKSFSKDKRSIFFTLTLMLFVVVAIFTTIGELSLPYISQLFSKPSQYYLLLRITLYLTSFTIINILFLNQLRADERSLAYSVIGIIKLIITLLLTIYLIIYLNQGIEAVLYGQLAGEIINFLIIFPMMIKKMNFHFNKKIIPESLRFGLPLIFATLAMNLLNGSDRYVLKYLSGSYDLGLYELGYKVAGVLNMFVIMPFSLAIQPMAYNYYKQEGDTRFYSKSLTYFTFILVWSGLALSLFSKELIITFSSSSSFYPAYKVVPLITLSYVFLGMATVASLGMYLTSKTSPIALINLGCASINLALNFLLIPKFGMIGAAINTLIAFIFLFYFYYFYANKYYKIEYEIKKLVGLIIIGCLLYIIPALIDDINVIFSVSIKSFVIIVFPFLLNKFNFFEKSEIEKIRIIAKLITNFSENKEQLNKLINHLNKTNNENSSHK